MMYDTILARSFSRHDQKKLGCGAFVGCLIIAFSVCTVFKPYLGPIPVLNLQLLRVGSVKMLMTEERRNPPVMTEEISNPPLMKEISNPPVMNPPVMMTKEISSPPPMTEEISNPSVMTEEVRNPPLMTKATSSAHQMDIPTKQVKLVCNFSAPRSDVCEMTGDIRIQGNSSTVFVPLTDNTVTLSENSSWIIRPYARKGDRTAMDTVREFTVKTVTSSKNIIPHCTHNHSVQAIVFSTSGYAGNHFHDFTDTVIPLYLTAREFNGEVQFVVTNKNPWWIIKYQTILKKLSKYEIIDIDKAVGVHCFPSMIVGLKQHKEFDIDPSRSPYSMKEFRKFLREAYSLKRETTIKLRDEKIVVPLPVHKTPATMGSGEVKRPRLLIISRKRTRSFTNEREIVKMAERLGFDVIMTEANSKVAPFAQLVNSCDVMMGVHGAGLTNIVFLPEKAVFIQIVPLGKMEWLANTDFGQPAKDMNLNYIEYKIGEKESSLSEQYPRDHQVFRDPNAIIKQGWLAFRAVYLDKQNVKLDVRRFRGTLIEAKKLLHL